MQCVSVATMQIMRNYTMVQVGNDQEMAQSDRKSNSKKLNRQLGTYTKKTFPEFK